jgi:hypothetical protein
MTDRDFSGGKIDKAVPITIAWQKKMSFDDPNSRWWPSDRRRRRRIPRRRDDGFGRQHMECKTLAVEFEKNANTAPSASADKNKRASRWARAI